MIGINSSNKKEMRIYSSGRWFILFPYRGKFSNYSPFRLSKRFVTVSCWDAITGRQPFRLAGAEIREPQNCTVFHFYDSRREETKKKKNPKTWAIPSIFLNSSPTNLRLTLHMGRSTLLMCLWVEEDIFIITSSFRPWPTNTN